MALWQVSIYLLPKKPVIKKFGEIPTQLKSEEPNPDPDFRDDRLSSELWETQKILAGDLLPLLQDFGVLQKWTVGTAGFRAFGASYTNDISITFDGKTNIVKELHCRLDIRSIDKSFIDKMLSLSTKFDCLLMDITNRLFPPDLEGLTSIILESDSIRFLHDPEKFLNGLR